MQRRSSEYSNTPICHSVIWGDRWQVGAKRLSPIQFNRFACIPIVWPLFSFHGPNTRVCTARDNNRARNVIERLWRQWRQACITPHMLSHATHWRKPCGISYGVTRASCTRRPLLTRKLHRAPVITPQVINCVGSRNQLNFWLKYSTRNSGVYQFVWNEPGHYSWAIQLHSSLALVCISCSSYCTTAVSIFIAIIILLLLLSSFPLILIPIDTY